MRFCAEYKEKLKVLNLGLEDRLTAKVGLLSGGQRQAFVRRAETGFCPAGRDRL
ncbi:hypothetical protein LOC08_02455 [Lactobacillus delbrueckii subsp. lactis]|nr:hypothetical protein [Lactobacillus delbrueckii]MCD5506147.1 hypothetical protein [Lactobacillus delbrueckii subsp. lactis]MCD5519690.1 hypothetical protein [Lactobacillus delbrueckii subsp. lactis]MCD5523228.1 hypothetical protein [Lactobacillus delbrueckii subsp. lactis]MCD5525121.1 hypothetical protein [Lactobacillus delbrueckii subsp. lactis]